MGKVKLKFAPLPSSLSIPILPPWAVINSWAITKPKPVHPLIASGPGTRKNLSEMQPL